MAFRTAIAVALLLGGGLLGYAIGTFPGAAARAADALPSDIFADSGSRVPLVKRDQLDEAGKKIYDDTVNGGRSIVGLRGPGGIRLYASRLNQYARATNQYLRFEAGLDKRLAELAILVTAREMDQHFEWYAHEMEGLKQGLEPATIDIVRYRRPTTGLGEKEVALIQLGREALGSKHKVSSATFAAANRLFGREMLINYIGLMGDYASTGIMLTAFDQQLPDGKISALPVP